MTLRGIGDVLYREAVYLIVLVIAAVWVECRSRIMLFELALVNRTLRPLPAITDLGWYQWQRESFGSAFLTLPGKASVAQNAGDR